MIVLRALASLLIGFALQAADPGDWEALHRLRNGQRIHVVRTNLKTVTGDFIRVTPRSLDVFDGRAEQSVPRDEVFRVTTRGGQGRRAAIGAAIGAAAGLGLTMAAAEYGGNSDGLEYVVAGGGAATGAAVGGVTGALIPANATVYRGTLPSRRP